MLHRWASVPVVALLMFVCLLAPLPAHAQQQAKVGLVAGYPSSVGVLWHVADAVALRPEVAVSKSSGDSSSSSGGALATGSGTSVAVGISGLFYVGKWESLRTYVSPRFTYARQTSDTVYGDTTPTSSSTATSYALIGSFGAEYGLGRRFAVFGEAGFGYSHQHSRYDTGSVVLYQAESTTKSWSTRTAVGVIVYF